MNIFFCINNAYVRFAAITILSILENNKGNINFYVLNSDIDDDIRAHLRSIVEMYPGASIDFICVKKEHFVDLKLNIKYISTESYYRYIIADLFPKINKGLYLDADLIINGDLTELYNTDIDNYYCAGVKDLYILETNYAKKLKLKNLYINSGVLLFNFSKIREDNMVQKLFENTKKMKAIIEYPDQDIINITFNDGIKEIDSVYNFASSNVAHEKHKRFRAIIIHYTGPIKPWSKKCRNGMRFVWRHYCEMYMKLWEGNISNIENTKPLDNFGIMQKVSDSFKWIVYRSIKGVF